jgi:hypothetical protein
VAEYTYSISLRLVHPSEDPAVFTQALGLQPFNSWIAGSPRITRTGTPLKGIREKSFWTVRLVDGASVNRPLSRALDEVLDDLADREGFFRGLARSGGRAELFIGWFFGGNTGDVFDHELLARLAEFKIDLSFDVYPDFDDDPDPADPAA